MRRLSLSPFILLACVLTSACTDQNTTIWITQVSAPALEDTTCVPSDSTIASPSWDPTVAPTYGAFLTIVNAVRGNASDIANDTNWVQIEGIDVTLTDASGNEIASYSVPVAGGTIPSSSGPTDLGQATVFATIVPATFAGAAGAAGELVIASIVPFGQTLGGLDVEGPPFNLPITIVPSTACFVCPDDASAFDACSPGQNGGCSVLPSTDPACATTAA